LKAQLGTIVKLSKQENEYIGKMCNILKDIEIVDELTRIRYGLGIKDRVTIDQVRKSRYKQGIGKKSGRGKCQIKKNKEK
tara:strand:+ start:69 stop:308 length:240 start_codon:yes stop_codon:yes gene_type:complete